MSYVGPGGAARNMEGGDVIPAIINSFKCDGYVVNITDRTVPGTRNGAVDGIAFVTLFMSFLTLALFPGTGTSSVTKAGLVLVTAIVASNGFAVSVTVPIG